MKLLLALLLAAQQAVLTINVNVVPVAMPPTVQTGAVQIPQTAMSVTTQTAILPDGSKLITTTVVLKMTQGRCFWFSEARCVG